MTNWNGVIMTEQDYFEQFDGEEPGIVCEYCGQFIPEGATHWVRFHGKQYQYCHDGMEQVDASFILMSLEQTADDH